MKKKLIAMVLGMTVCIGQVEAKDGQTFSPIPSKPLESLSSTIYNSLLDNQFGELLSSAVD